MALKQIKNKITSTKKTGQVTKAMEAVSAVKMRKTQERALASRPYVHTALRMLARLAASRDVQEHPLASRRTSGATLLVVVTSDKGLAGSVNSAVLKRAEQICRDHQDVEVLAVGRKAVDFARRMNVPLVGEYTNVRDNVTIDDVTDMTNVALDAYARGVYQQVFVTYQNFVSTFEQQPVMRRVLPLDRTELDTIAADIRPAHGRYSAGIDEAHDGAHTYTIEPSAAVVLDALIPQLARIVLYHALTESKASEHSARMVAMKSATDKTKEVVRSLTLAYNKERQSVITAEVSEITGGIEAMKTA